MHFVVGHPRSGTRLVADLLSAGAGEGAGASRPARHEYLVTTTRGQLVRAASEYYEETQGKSPALLQAAAATIRDAVGAASRPLLDHLPGLGALQSSRAAKKVRALVEGSVLDPAVVVDCSWKNTWVLPLLLEMYPDARVLHLTRDPRENVLGCYNLDYYGTFVSRPEAAEYKELLVWHRGMPRVQRPDWDTLSQLAQNCAFWAETHRLVLTAIPLGSRHRYAVVKLEDLTGYEPIAGLFRFFDLPVPPEAEIERVRTTQVNAKPVEKKLVAGYKRDLLPRFRECPADVKQTVRDLCGPMAERLGYLL